MGTAGEIKAVMAVMNKSLRPPVSTNMNTSIIVAVVVGCLALFVAIKVGRFIMKVIFGLIALALLGGAAWWFLLRQ